jgi:hypothetical protein
MTGPAIAVMNESLVMLCNFAQARRGRSERGVSYMLACPVFDFGFYALGH